MVGVGPPTGTDDAPLSTAPGAGMQYMHSRSVIHRDLKSPNVLLATDSVLKISDFGTCRHDFGRSTKMSVIGTCAWVRATHRHTSRVQSTVTADHALQMAPEMIRHEPCSSRVDVWSFGVVLWELLSGEVPYKVRGTRNQSDRTVLCGMGPA